MLHPPAEGVGILAGETPPERAAIRRLLSSESVFSWYTPFMGSDLKNNRPPSSFILTQAAARA
jgi:hypothetical protein